MLPSFQFSDRARIHAGRRAEEVLKIGGGTFFGVNRFFDALAPPSGDGAAAPLAARLAGSPAGGQPRHPP
jgi:hypothetical protein